MRIFDGMKFRVRNSLNSRQIQDALFKAGYRYNYPTLETYQWLNKPFLFANTGGVIGYADKTGAGVYEASHYEEHFVYGNSFYKSNTGDVSIIGQPPRLVGQWNEDKPVLGLKPRALHDAARLKDLLAAMTRYAEAGTEIPEAWIVELFTVSKGAQTKIIASEIVS